MAEPLQKPSIGGKIGEKEDRKLRAQRLPVRSVWAGFGFFGLIGWSVVAPTLVGAALGRWIDRAYPGERNWTLALLVAGLTLGCLNAWHWVEKEHRAIRKDQEEDLSDDK